MWKAIAHKELRDTLWLAALGLAAYAYLVGTSTGVPFIPAVYPFSRYYYSGGTIPFVGDDFLTNFVLISAALAIGVGIHQSLGESRHGTWLFLLHRPVERKKIIAWKLAVGMVICLGTMALPILVYAWWAATPGTHPSPFEWSMTGSSWRAWFSMTPIYLGAFLVGMRPARWFGSRLLPLVAAGLLAFVIAQLMSEFAAISWRIVGVTAIVVLDAWLTACVFHVARARDY
jgi:hypothetical protein